MIVAHISKSVIQWLKKKSGVSKQAPIDQQARLGVILCPRTCRLHEIMMQGLSCSRSNSNPIRLGHGLTPDQSRKLFLFIANSLVVNNQLISIAFDGATCLEKAHIVIIKTDSSDFKLKQTLSRFKTLLAKSLTSLQLKAELANLLWRVINL